MAKNDGRRLPIGAEPGLAGTSFRVWAPERKTMAVIVEGREPIPLDADGGGYFAGTIEGLGAGARYRFQPDGGGWFPDPAARFQPDGPNGPSEIIDSAGFAWTDDDWAGVELAGQVIYELHIGTFTREGTYTAAIEKLPLLAEVGITVIEIMPIAEFPGRFGWGYDGVNLFAPSHLYGRPDDLRRFIDRAHALGIGVILDVVYNHFGPDGNYLSEFTGAYFATRHVNEWGDAINFDGEESRGVREFFLANVDYWIAEFHFDGLRLDATQAIHDDSGDHILAGIVGTARRAAGTRKVIIVAENEPQETRLIRSPEAGGYGLDGVWNDDFHHSASVAMTGRRQAYYSDHAGVPQEFISAAKYGFLFQGQLYGWQKGRRGRPGLELDPKQFVLFVENHDQVANTGHSRRFHQRTTPGRARAMTALFLLLPGTPLLFQGQDYWSTRPFFYFADHKPELAKAVNAGRREFLAQFPSLADEDMAARIADPGDPQTFVRSTLDWDERATRRESVALHTDLLRLRRTVPAFAAQAKGGLDGIVVGPEAFAIRFFAPDAMDRLLFVNFGVDQNLRSIADPLVAPPPDMRWRIEWSSEDPRYAGGGTPPVEHKGGWHIPGHAAVLLAPIQAADADELPDAPFNPQIP